MTGVISVSSFRDIFILLGWFPLFSYLEFFTLLYLRYSILHPEFIMQPHDKPGGPSEYSCRLQLPCNAPFEELEGPLCSSMRLAQQACTPHFC